MYAGRAVLVLVVMVSATSGRMLHAQITPQQLLATSVEKFEASKFKDVSRAIVAFQKGQVGEAKALLEGVAARNSSLVPVEVMMALLHFSANQRAEGEAALDHALINHPEDPEARIILADLAMRENHAAVAHIAYASAQDVLDRYEANPWRKRVLQVRVFAGLASLEESRGRHRESIVLLENWEKLDPGNPLVHGSLGRLRFRLQDYTGARTAFERLVSVESNAPPVEIAMGRLYSDAGMQAEALKDMSAAVQRQDKDIRVRLAVAEWALSQGVLELAKTNVNASLALDNEALGALVLQARIARVENDMGQAESILSSAILRQPNNFAVANELARVLAVSSDPEKRKTGLEYARRNYEATKSAGGAVSHEAVVTFAWLLACNEKVQQAERILLTLPDGSTTNSENVSIAGAIYAKQGRLQLAIQTLDAALGTGISFPGRQAAEALRTELKAQAASR